jgi:hypothetical protein
VRLQVDEVDRATHNAEQARVFDSCVDEFVGDLPPEVPEVLLVDPKLPLSRQSVCNQMCPSSTFPRPCTAQRLAAIAASIPLGAQSRVLDVGSGTGALLPFLQVSALLVRPSVCPPVCAMHSSRRCPSTHVRGARLSQLPLCTPVGQLASRSVGRSVSRSASRSASQPASQSVK